jgi:hypothetical protein
LDRRNATRVPARGARALETADTEHPDVIDPTPALEEPPGR